MEVDSADLPGLSSSDRPSVSTLILREQTLLPDISDLTNLKRLRFYHCDLGNNGVGKLPPAIRYMVVSSSLIRGGLVAVERLPELFSLRLDKSDDVSLAPTRSLQDLEFLTARACPLDEWSYYELPELLEARDCEVDLSDEADWAMTRRLHEAGLPVVFEAGEAHVLGTYDPGYIKTTIDALDDYLKRPGITWQDIWNDHGWGAQKMLVQHLRETGQTISLGQPEALEPRFNWEDHREVGPASMAHDWVEGSALASDDKVRLQRFVDRFPQMTFQRWKEPAVAFMEKLSGLGFPDHYRHLLKTFDGPCSSTGFYFKLRSDSELRGYGDGEYYVQRPSRIGEDELDLVHEAGWLTFADDSGQALAIAHDGQSRAVVGLTVDQIGVGDWGPASALSLFASVAEVFDFIVEIRVDDVWHSAIE